MYLCFAHHNLFIIIKKKIRGITIFSPINPVAKYNIGFTV